MLTPVTYFSFRYSNKQRETVMVDQLKAETYARFAEQVNIVIQEVFADNPDPKMVSRKGSYFSVTNLSILLVGGLVGAVPLLEKRKKYAFLSLEKCERTFGHRCLGHRSSRESMDESRQRFPGAVAGYVNEYGFSGYTADVDEVAATLLAFLCGDLRYADVKKLLARNPCFGLFHESFVKEIDRRPVAATGL